MEVVIRRFLRRFRYLQLLDLQRVLWDNLYLVTHLVDELSLPLAHDLSFILIVSLDTEFPEDVYEVCLKVVQLDEDVLEVEFSLEHLRHFVDLRDLSPEVRLFLAAEMAAEEELEELDEGVLIAEEHAQLLPEAELFLIDGLLVLESLSDLEIRVEALEVLHQELTDDEEEAWDTRN